MKTTNNNVTSIDFFAAQAIANNPKEANSARVGKEKDFNFLVGQAIRASHGTINPKLVADAIRKLL